MTLIQQWLNKSRKLTKLNSSVRNISAKSKPSSDYIRKQFIDFYSQNHDHQYVHSSPVVLKNDKSLLFVNAGMNQFKSIFLNEIPSGSSLSNYSRVVNYQKCIRAGGHHNDLDDVGKDLYHHTFFEMLGTWSFGNYFKKEACSMAWYLLTEVFKLPKDRLYVTYFVGDEKLGIGADEECHDIWRSLNIADDHILGGETKDNFWEMGFTGPCGPCTEIHFDHIGGRNASHLVNFDDPSVTEIWNLVFIQYNRLDKTKLERLSKQFVDCGMGFERLVAILQGKFSNYDTDLFTPIFKEMESLSSVRPYSGYTGKDDGHGIDCAYRKVADHVRMLTVAIVDGCLPDAVNQGNVLRRIIREAINHADHKLRMGHNNLAKLVPVIIETLQNAYPELYDQQSKVIDVVNNEEEKYRKLLARGNSMLDDIIPKLRDKYLFPGEKAWQLYSSHGYPLSLLEMVLSQKEIAIDWPGLYAAKQLSQERQAKNSKFVPDFNDKAYINLLQSGNITETNDSFKYSYKNSSLEGFGSMETQVLALFMDKRLVDSVQSNDECVVVTSDTIFYAEEGGQTCDIGTIVADESEYRIKNILIEQMDIKYGQQMGISFVCADEDCQIDVTSVRKHSGYVLHFGIVKSGNLSPSTQVILQLNKNRRIDCMRNHTATHLLHHFLRKSLGSTHQQSSHVCSEYLRFDYQSENPLSLPEIQYVESKVNECIKDSVNVNRELISSEQLMKIENIVTIPGEIYPDPVTLIKIGNFCIEPCCGTHVTNTAELDSFAILSNKSVSQTVKSVKAITGRYVHSMIKKCNALEYSLNDVQREIKELSQRRPKNDAGDVESILKMLNRLKHEVKKSEISILKKKYMEDEIRQAKSKVNQVHKVQGP